MLNDIAMLGAETSRTQAYLLALGEAGLLPSKLLLLKRDGGAANSEIERLARSGGVPVVIVNTNDINDAQVVTAVASLPQKYVIVSGPAGAILRKALFETGKKFIHIHPGRLPEFRGSTTIYYSLLAEGKVEATALMLAESIDVGPIIARAEFEPPADRQAIDGSYDPQIRAALLSQVMRTFSEHGRFEPVEQPASGETFYIIHPVLKHLAILAS